MAQYYQIQNLDDLKQIYADVQVVHVASDDVGQIVLDETQQILLQNDGPQQVVYQTQGTPTQYQPPQAGTHYTILGEDMNQPQAQTVQHQQVQQVQQQQAQTQQQHQQAPQQQQQQQVLMHQQHHQVLDPQQQQQQQHQLQAAYQMPQETLQQPQHMQPQDHQMQQHVQAQPQQIYYTTDQLVHQQQQQQQKKVYIQQQPQQLQQQYQPHPQHQQQMIHQAPPPPQAQQQTQQHILQSPQHHPQQVQVQHQVSPSHQQQTQQQAQIIYRMQPQQTQQLQQLIVQQPSGQQVLIQQPQQQELIMRQSMPPQRIIYNNRVLYSTQQQSPQQQQHTVMGQSPQTHQQQHILQTTHTTMQQHHNPTHLVQQARVVPSQHQQQQTQQQTPPPPPQQQMQQNVVYQQIQVQNNQMPKTLMQQQQPTQNSPQHQQHIQLQQQQQQQQTQMVTQAPNPNGTTIIRAGVARGGKIGRGAMSGTLIARMPGMAGVARAEIRPGFNAAGAIGGGGGQILRTPRPRCSTTAGSTSRGRGRGARGAAANVTAGRGSPILGNNQQLGTLQQGKIVTQSLPNQGIRQVYRTQVNDPNLTVQQQQHQQVHLVQAQPRMPGVASRFRSPAIGTQQQQHQQSPSESGQQAPSSSSSGAAGAGGGGAGLGDLDLEDSIQAVFVKKDAQQPKVAGAPNQSPTTVLSSGNSTPVSGTTLTTYYTAKDDDENRMIRTQNGTCMSLAEFKKRNANASGNQIIQNAAAAGSIKPLQQTAGGAKISLPAAGQSLHSVPVARVAPQKHIVSKEQGGAGGVATSVAGGANATSSSVTNPQIPSGPPAGSSVYQTSHNNYEIQTQHVLQNRAGQQMAEKDRNSAKMLVILVSGEQRLITFTLPRESCTVQDLLEQVGVPFDNSTTIQCVENPGANIDFVVTVGFSVQESASELISRAEQSLQISRQQESMQQNAAAAVTGSQAAAATAGTNTTEGNAQNNSAATTAATVAATAPNIAQTTENSTKEPNNSKQATTANAATTSAASSTSKATEELPQRKLIQGFYAICQSCGFSGYDHAKCERCKRVFMEPPKKIPIKQATASPSLGSNFANSNNSGSADSPTPSSTAPPIEKKRHSETAAQRGKSSLTYNPNAPAPPTRGRGGSQSARGRGSRSGRRAAEIEPVILTLSSDEEDDESSNKGNSNMAALAKPSNTSSSASLASYKPFSFEPNMPDPDETALYNDFTRGDVTDLTNCADKMSCSLACKLIRFGTYRFEPSEQVIITSLGIRIVAPLETNPSEMFALNIYKHEVVKIIAHFSKSSSANSMLCFYTLRNCAQYIQKSLNMTEVAKHLDGVTYFSANGPYQIRKIILQFDIISEQAKSVIRSIWDFLDEISETDAQDLLQRAADSDKKLANNKNNSENIPTTTQLQPNEIRQLLIYPPGKGGISINTEDYMCLATDQYLNDIIIDFYLKWVHDNVIPEAQKERTHIFSTFFYKRLTTLTRHTHHDKDGGKLTPAQKRHARVQNWTKNVNLFEKDFIVIPINEQSHWFLAIICFPRLKGPVTFDTNTPVELQPIKKNKGKKVSLQIGNTTITPLSKRDSASVLSEICGVGDDDSERDEAEGDDSDLASEDSDFDNTSSSTTLNSSQPATPLIPGTATTSTHQPIKQPLILIFDSLAGASRSRVVATLRDYLTCEYKIKMTGAPLHTFNKDNMPGHCVKVPQQNNFTDCGLYLLQYVEHFFKDPIRDYRVPIKQLAQWFDTLTVTRKREDISNLLQKLMNERNGPNNKIILPEIPFPTLNGQLVEPEGYNIEFEEEEMEDDDEEENTTGDMDELSTDDTSKSKTPIKMPTTATTVAATTTTTTAAALVPTQGRKIVVKRRMQIGGSNDLNSSQVNAAATTCGTPPATSSTATSSHQRTSSMAKIRKVES